eukprot:1158758-Pelagomonas_calceolata.AAC.1
MRGVWLRCSAMFFGRGSTWWGSSSSAWWDSWYAGDEEEEQRVWGKDGSIQPHSETPLNNLANVGFLPFAEEVGAMKRLQYRDRMRLPIVDEEMTGDDEEVFRPRGHRRSGEFLRAHHREAKPEKVVSWDGVLEPDARTWMLGVDAHVGLGVDVQAWVLDVDIHAGFDVDVQVG